MPYLMRNKGGPEQPFPLHSAPNGKRILLMDTPTTTARRLQRGLLPQKSQNGQAVPRHAKNSLKWRMGIPVHLITFQVMRRSLETHLSGHGRLKDTQGALRHASITTTGNVYVRLVEESVMRAVNSHAA
jgi:integrase